MRDRSDAECQTARMCLPDLKSWPARSCVWKINVWLENPRIRSGAPEWACAPASGMDGGGRDERLPRTTQVVKRDAGQCPHARHQRGLVHKKTRRVVWRRRCAFNARGIDAQE